MNDLAESHSFVEPDLYSDKFSALRVCGLTQTAEQSTSFKGNNTIPSIHQCAVGIIIYVHVNRVDFRIIF